MGFLAIPAVQAALAGAAVSSVAMGVTSHQQNVSQKRIAREQAAKQREMEMNRRRIATEADRKAVDLEAQKQKVASSRVRSKSNQLLGLKGIQQRGTPAPTGFSGITSNVLQEST